MDRRKVLLVVAVVVAALGAGLVFVYAQGAEDRAADKLQTVPVLVAQQQILPGESAADAADAGKLISEQVPADEVVDGATNDGNDFADTIALTTIYPGEQLLTQKFGTIADIEGKPTLPLPTGKTAITLQLTDAGRVGNFTQPGSHVAVYFTPPADTSQLPGGTSSSVALVVPACVIEDDLLVLGVGSQTVNQPTAPEGDTSNADTIPVTLLTVAVDSEQASTLIGFQSATTSSSSGNQVSLTFALRNDESDVRNTKACAQYLKAFQNQLELTPGRSSANG